MESGLCFRPQLSVLFENDGGLPVVVVVVVVVVMRGPLLVLLPYRLDSNATLCCPVGYLGNVPTVSARSGFLAPHNRHGVRQKLMERRSVARVGYGPYLPCNDKQRAKNEWL